MRRGLRVVSIDVGIVNLAISSVDILGHEECDFRWSHLVDITQFGCNRRTCTLMHDACHSDWMDHFIRRFHESFDEADFVLVERQPPQGHKAIEALLVSAFRQKIRLIHPRSFQAFMRIGVYDYEMRKRMVERAALARFPAAASALDIPRSHDVAESLLFCLYFSTRKEVARLLPPPSEPQCVADAAQFFEQFRCKRRKQVRDARTGGPRHEN